MVERRVIKKILLGLCAGLAIIIGALQATAATIGVLLPAKGVPSYDAAHQNFLAELARQGFGPDKADIILQQPTPTTMSWINAVRKFVALDVDVMVTHGAATTLAAMHENHSIPIVYCAVYNPAALGITGRNITGAGTRITVQGLIRNFRRIANFKRLGILYNSEEKNTEKQADNAAALGGQLGFKTVRRDVKNDVDKVKLPDADALFLTTAGRVTKNITSIIAQARAAEIPTSGLLNGLAEQGIVLTLYADPQQQGAAAAKMVAAILHGKKPAAIPADISAKIKMAVNLKEAKNLHLNIPFDMLGTAKLIK